MLIYRDCILVLKCLRGLAPDYIAKKFKKRSEIHNKNTRNKNKMDIPGYTTKNLPLSSSFTMEFPTRKTHWANKPCIIQKGIYVSFTKRILEALLYIYCKYLVNSCYIRMILIISYCFIVLHILLNIVITLKSQNLESNEVIIYYYNYISLLSMHNYDMIFSGNWNKSDRVKEANSFLKWRSHCRRHR